jgi:hypothetical protein
MAELGAFFGNPNIQRQGARARALAGQRDVNTLPDPLTYAVVQGLLGTRPDEMGFSVLNPDYEKIKKVAEPAFALGLLGQAAPALAPLTKGLPVGASIKNVGDDYFKLNSLLTKASQDLSKNPSKETFDAYQSLLKARDVAPNNPTNNVRAVTAVEETGYRGEHTAPLKDSGRPAHNLAGAYPDDFYSPNGVQYYGTGDARDASIISQFQSLKDKPNQTITIYRAVPKNTPKGKAISQGDWVTTDYRYAKEHGEGALNGDYRIVKKEVAARDIYTNGDSIYEWGYDPQPRVRKSAPKKEALTTQQTNNVEYPLAPAGTRYEEFGGELTYMTPDEYLSRVRPLELDETSLENIASLKSHVQSGGKLDPLHIYKDGKEDGRHRAYMAKELGIEKIPVALHTEANNLGQNLPIDALSLLAEQQRKQITGLLE